MEKRLSSTERFEDFLGVLWEEVKDDMRARGVRKGEFVEVGKSVFGFFYRAMMVCPADMFFPFIGSMRVSHKRLQEAFRSLLGKRGKYSDDVFRDRMRDILRIAVAKSLVHSKERSWQRTLEYIREWDFLLF